MPHTVLIVDDVPDMIEVLTQVFEKAGATVVSTTKGQQAVDMALAAQAEGKPYDMIIVDIRMPDMDGNEVAKKIREAKYDGPIVAFTANATGTGRNASQSSGIDTYLSKDTLSVDLVRALLNNYPS